ncbi:winged helix-turn-helix domain-containing protein [Marinobacter orientalis]|uniref:LysR family transcriptional regulator n=1 Tax=Marinobacter orientalis TaxID=1928859 RepID=A0A7Y0NK06_9GAMM|nr:LysR family transcriptional regulator [Marinobacter orientalis]NMT62434.1 LysR family transcriptional regulator [Marinobacter orientalis]TGX51134.1 LysR family transcriptional regulator [Marinobacter orientalis]
MSPEKSKPCAVLVRPRLYIGDGITVGPGKIDLLRAVGVTRSMAAAARSLGIPYKRAWLLINTLNEGFGQPVVATATGGKGGGGASLTTLGQELVVAYDALEERLNTEAAPELEALRRLANCCQF